MGRGLRLNRSGELRRAVIMSFIFWGKLVGAQDFEGNWTHSEKICELEGMVPCTAEELNESGTSSWTCGTEFQLRQHGSHICGVWWNGCSGRVKVYGGNVVGETMAGNGAKVWLDGSFQPTPRSEPFPDQRSEQAMLRIDNERLVIEHDRVGLIFKELERNPVAKPGGAIDQGFLSKCLAGVTLER